MRWTLLAAVVVSGFDLAVAVAQAPAEPIQPAPLASTTAPVTGGRGTPHLGVNLTEIPYQGLRVGFVDTGGPAETAGLRAGDTVQTINGQSVRTHVEFRDVLGRATSGTVVQLDVLRAGQALKINVTPTHKTGIATTGIATAPVNTSSAARPVNRNRGLGVVVFPVTLGNYVQLGLREARGLQVVQVNPGTPAAREQIPVNAVITEFNGRPVSTLDELSAAIIDTEPTRQVPIKYTFLGQPIERYLQLDPVLDPYAVAQPTLAPVQPRFANNVSATTVTTAPGTNNDQVQQALQRLESQINDIKAYLRSKDSQFSTGS